ncbi:hypothetical protein ACFQL4_20925 [Halosimplex aquaticum]
MLAYHRRPVDESVADDVGRESLRERDRDRADDLVGPVVAAVGLDLEPPFRRRISVTACSVFTVPPISS